MLNFGGVSFYHQHAGWLLSVEGSAITTGLGMTLKTVDARETSVHQRYHRRPHQQQHHIGHHHRHHHNHHHHHHQKSTNVAAQHLP